MLASLLLLLTSCGDGGGEISWEFRFVNDALLGAATVVDARIREGGCSGAIIYSAEIARGDMGMAMSPPVLDDGSYGFEGEARDGNCRAFAGGCVEVTIPRETPVVVEMSGISPMQACPPAMCSGGRCGGGGTDGGMCTATETVCDDSDDNDCDMMTDCADSDCASSPACEACGEVICGACSVCTDGMCETAPDGEACGGGSCQGGECCTGCWDGSACQGGSEGTACGSGGGACAVCEDDCGTCSGGSCSNMPSGTMCMGGMGLCADGTCCTGARSLAPALRAICQPCAARVA